MKPFIPKMKSYYAVKFTGLDASGNIHTFTTDLDGYDKENAKKKLQKFADAYGIKIEKIMNFASFADPAGAIYQVEMWNKEMLRSRDENNENQHKNMGFSE